jgi:hypothetical protein
MPNKAIIIPIALTQSPEIEENKLLFFFLILADGKKESQDRVPPCNATRLGKAPFRKGQRTVCNNMMSFASYERTHPEWRVYVLENSEGVELFGGFQQGTKTKATQSFVTGIWQS